ncbi:hypothetical protein IFR04_003342 [Cadophora malorum]|uniref:Cell wall glycoprotein n=1 Tax=Cadophora malorum TaxID=108018 RepID=A0A8H8BTV2_9HELO|nr:hypothetical protein IFR04_003342 [Cadophora malorum]
MVARSVSLLAALAATASAYGYEYQNTTTSTSKPAYETSTLSTPVEYPTTSVETTVYTTVCPATSYSTSGTKTYTSVYTTTSTITSCKGGCPTYVPNPDCEKVRSDCQSKPDANQSYCASLYVQCAGTTSGLNKPPAHPTSSAPATKDCEKVRSDCQSKPDANQSYCASLYVQCAGTTSGLNKPPAYPTASTPATKDCEKVRSDCQSKPDANQSHCASLYVQCAGTTSGLNKPPVETTVYTTVCPATTYITSGTETKTSVYTTTSTITTCKGGCPTTYVSHPTTSPVDVCQDKFNKCRNGEDGGDRNQARCAAEFAACQSSTKTSAPAPTSTPIDACQNKFNMCRNGEDGGDRNQARCAAEFAACQGPTATEKTYAPAPTTSTTPVDTCQVKFNKCRNGEDGGDRNQSRCAAEFAACQGPTATEKTAAPTSSATTPIDACQDKLNKCRNGEDGGDRNQSRCASEFAACKGGSGSTVETHPPATSAYKTEGVETHPAQTYPASTLATYTPTTVGAPSATTSSVQYTGAASSLKVGSAGLSGVLALVFLL